MSETKPGMPSPALTEEDVRRLIREEINACLFDMNTAISYLSNWNLTIDQMQQVIQLSMRKDTSEDQGEYNDIQEVSVKDSVTAD